MCMNKQTNNRCCCIYAILASLIGAAGVAGLFLAGLITTISVLLYVTLGLGILGLLYLILTALCGRKSECSILKNNCLVESSVGSIITSIFALTATALTPVSIPLAILIGAVAFFLFSNIFNLINIFIRKLCSHDCDD